MEKLSYTVKCNSRDILLTFIAENDLWKTHAVVVQAKHIATGHSWEFQIKIGRLNSAQSVMDYAQEVISSRSKHFWTQAVQPLVKEVEIRRKRVQHLADLWLEDATVNRTASQQRFDLYYKDNISTQFYQVQLGYGTVLKIVNIIISCL